MTRKWLIPLALPLLAALLLAALLLAAPALAEAAEEDAAEWTVMFYMCGSDLESRHGYATGNLRDILRCNTYDVTRHYMQGDREDERRTIPAGVNVVVETGGSEAWHAREEIDTDIAADRLQRWHFHPFEWESVEWDGKFILDGEAPLQSMADPDTLADFIRWSAENYPAKKYALVLWDHGGGARTGIFIDELFGGDTLRLDELRQALADGGVTFEAVLFDACMMANLETACAVKDSARWMIASEEIVAGKGTAVINWLQQLYYTPDCDGERLGRWVCDMTEAKYAAEGDAQAQSMFTWSVIDLSRIARVAEMFDAFFKAGGRCYASDPYRMASNAEFLTKATEFGLGDNDMYDLAGIFYQPYIAGTMDRELYAGMLEALAEAVVYNVHGPDRSGALGLSFCYAAHFSAEELDIYARNCPSPNYLAFLDAINPSWTAPDRVYEAAERLPDIRDIEDYRIPIEKRLSPSGIPGLCVYSNMGGWEVHADLYRLDEETGHTVRLGSVLAVADLNTDDYDHLVCTVENFWMWPAVEGVHCDAELVDYDYEDKALYNIPIQLGAETALLRCGYDLGSDEVYTVYGLWEGYDADSGVYDHNVMQLSQLAGREYSLLYPIDGTGGTGKTKYVASEPLTMYRSLEMSAQPLPAGTYYFDFWIKDMFMRRLNVDRAEMYWDGEKVTVPEGSWQGEMTLLAPET